MTNRLPVSTAPAQAGTASEERRTTTWMRRIIDAILVLAVGFAGGFLVGVVTSIASVPTSQVGVILGLTNLLTGIVGFTVVGVRAPGNRWRHLAFVALLFWLGSSFNILAVGFWPWFVSAIFAALFAALGGALSYLFRRGV